MWIRFVWNLPSPFLLGPCLFFVEFLGWRFLRTQLLHEAITAVVNEVTGTSTGHLRRRSMVRRRVRRSSTRPGREMSPCRSLSIAILPPRSATQRTQALRPFSSYLVSPAFGQWVSFWRRLDQVLLISNVCTSRPIGETQWLRFFHFCMGLTWFRFTRFELVSSSFTGHRMTW